MARATSKRRSPSVVPVYPSKDISNAAKRRQVYLGHAQKMKSGLTARELTENKWGKIVSKRRSSNAKRRYANDAELRATLNVYRKRKSPQ